MTETPKHHFWDFSLALYGREGVARACIALQDRWGLDVNILLFCCRAGSRGRRLDSADLKSLDAAVRPWREAVVVPLRGIRRWLKTQAPAPGTPAHRLRVRVKADELQAEAVEQALLAQTLKIPQDPQDCDTPVVIARNILAYVAFLELGLQAADLDEFATVLGACCPELAPGEAISLLNHPETALRLDQS